MENGIFQGSEGGENTSWKIIGSDDAEWFIGSFPKLCKFLLNSTADSRGNRKNPNKRKAIMVGTNRRKHLRKGEFR